MTHRKMLVSYCSAVKISVLGWLNVAVVNVALTNTNCNNVFILLIVVGLTSADGMEKSKYRTNVFLCNI